MMRRGLLSMARRYCTEPLQNPHGALGELQMFEKRMPKYFEVFQDHLQTFNRFSSDPPWVVNELAEACQATQRYYVEDAIRHFFEDSPMNLANYYAETYSYRIIKSDRVMKNGMPAQTTILFEREDISETDEPESEEQK